MLVKHLEITKAYLQYIRRTFDKGYHMLVQNLEITNAYLQYICRTSLRSFSE